MSLIHGKLIFVDRAKFVITVLIVVMVLKFNRFNYRATAHMVEHGFYNFLNWYVTIGN